MAAYVVLSPYQVPPAQPLAGPPVTAGQPPPTPAVNPDAPVAGQPRELNAAQQAIACFNCNNIGHLARHCPLPPKEGLCFRCHQPGHRARDCPQALAEQQQQYAAYMSLLQPVAPAATATCFNCGQAGHLARQCRLPRGGGSASGTAAAAGAGGGSALPAPPPPPPMMMMPYGGYMMPAPAFMPTLLSTGSQPPQCYVCREVGHIARNCPSQPKGAGASRNGCYKCSKPGHLARDCTEPEASTSAPAPATTQATTATAETTAPPQ